MQKKFLSNLFLLLLLNLLIKPFWIFGIDRTIQNIVGAEQYGLYFSLLNFSFLFSILSDLGISNFNNRNIAMNRQLFSKHLVGISILKFFLAFFYIIITLIAGYILKYNQLQIKILAILSFNQILASFIMYFRSNLGALHLFKTDSIISVLDRTLLIIFCSILLWSGITSEKFKIIWFVYLQTISYLIVFIILLVILISKVEIKKKLSFKISLPFFILIIKKSFPFALLILLMTLYTRIDGVMIERMLYNGKSEAGIYAQAFRILDAGSMVAFLFATLLLPIFARMLKLKDDISSIVKLSFNLLFTYSLIISVYSFFYANEIMKYLYLENINESSKIFSILIFALIFFASNYIFGTLLTANGNLRELNFIALGAVLLNIILNYFLIPIYGAYGAAFATLITQFIASILQILFALNYIQLNTGIKYWLRHLILITGIFFTAYYSKEISSNTIIASTIYFIFATLFAFSIKIINITYIIKVFKNLNYD